MSEFWKRKMRTFFERRDFDKDGVIWKRDFELMAEGYSAAEKVDPVKEEQLKKIAVDIWLLYTGSMKTYQKEFLTAAMLIDSLKKQRNDPQLKTKLQDTFLSFFDAMDTLEDGYLQLVEYRRAIHKGGMPDTSFAEQAFNVVDTNHNGKLSLDELTHAIVEFMLSEDEDSPYNLMYGPLIQA